MSRAFRLTVQTVTAVAAIACIVAIASNRPARADDAAKPAAPQSHTELTEHQKAVHVLNRLAFGPRPGEVERVEKMGIDAYVRQQLHPEKIDDSAAEKALEPLTTLKMSSGHLLASFFDDVKGFLQTQMAAGNGEDMKLRYGIDPGKAGATTKPAEPAKKPTMEEWASHDAVRAVGELQQAKLIRAALSERQLQEVLVDFWSNHFNEDVKKAPVHALKTADDRDVIRPHVLGKFRDLLGAVAHSPAMLVYLDNNENSVPRERGKLETFAIDVVISAKLGMSTKGMIAAKEGPNENYGRELLELHTLGVDGGYTQKDVQEVARCFSGWSYSPFSGTFNFESHRHDPAEKTVLGHTIPAKGGAKDGEKALDILAAHPSTAHFISRKLCQRFVADEPSQKLVERVAKVFTDTDGNLRKVVEAIITDPEFYAPHAYRAKIKSPFEFAVSAVRATNGRFFRPIVPLWDKLRAVREGGATMGYGSAELSNAKKKTLNWHVYDMGEPLFSYAAPTGYSEVSSKWVSSGALIDRLNFALALTGDDVTDVRVDVTKLIEGADADAPDAVLAKLSDALLHGDIAPGTRRTVEKAAVPQAGEGKTVDVKKVAALLIGSPEFQRR